MCISDVHQGQDRCGLKQLCLLIVRNASANALCACRHRALNSCLLPLYAAEGCHVVTVEGEAHSVHSEL